MRRVAIRFEGTLARRILMQPDGEIFAHLLNVVWNVAFLAAEPLFESDFSVHGMNRDDQPAAFRDGLQKLGCGGAETVNDFERFARALMEVAKRIHPRLNVGSAGGASRGNDLTAEDVIDGFAIGEMEDHLVDAAAAGGRLEEPHAAREFAHSQTKGRRSVAEGIESLAAARLHGDPPWNKAFSLQVSRNWG